MSVGYAREKFSVAASSLVQGRGRIKERLGYAVHSFFPLLPDRDLPPNLQAEYKAIVRDVTCVPGPDGSIEATIQSMSEDDAADIAERIFNFYEKLR